MIVAAAHGSLSAGPVVAVLAVITVVVVLAVLAMAYLLHWRDRR